MKIEIEEAVLMKLANEHVTLAIEPLNKRVQEEIVRFSTGATLDRSLLKMLIDQIEEKKKEIYSRYGIIRQEYGVIQKSCQYEDFISLGFGVSYGCKEYEVYSNKASTIFIKYIKKSNLMTILKSSSRDENFNMPIMGSEVFKGYVNNIEELKFILKFR